MNRPRNQNGGGFICAPLLTATGRVFVLLTAPNFSTGKIVKKLTMFFPEISLDNFLKKCYNNIVKIKREKKENGNFSCFNSAYFRFAR